MDSSSGDLMNRAEAPHEVFFFWTQCTEQNVEESIGKLLLALPLPQGMSENCPLKAVLLCAG